MQSTLKNGRVVVRYYQCSLQPDLLPLDTSMLFIVCTSWPMQIINCKTVAIHSNSSLDNIWMAKLQIQLDLLSLFC